MYRSCTENAEPMTAGPLMRNLGAIRLAAWDSAARFDQAVPCNRGTTWFGVSVGQQARASGQDIG
jgi:hypothetical protein